MLIFDEKTFIKNDILYIEKGVIKMNIQKSWVILDYIFFHKNYDLLNWLVLNDIFERIENEKIVHYFSK